MRRLRKHLEKASERLKEPANPFRRSRGRSPSPAPLAQSPSAGPAASHFKSSAPASSNPRTNLWDVALGKLSDADRQTLRRHVSGPSVDIDSLCQLAAAQRDRCEQRRWVFTFRGREIILRDMAAKVLAWLDVFKQVGDIAANYDPHHFALPWAGVRFLLAAAIAEQEQAGALLVGVEKVAHLVSRCSVYDDLYRADLHGEKALSDLENSLVRLYAVILQFLASAILLFAKAPALRAVHAVLHPDEVEKFVAECEGLERSLEADAANCERVVQRSARAANAQQLQALLTALREPLVRTDPRVEELLARFSEAETCSILQWVSRIPYASHHIAAKEGRTKGTAEWILQHTTFRKWRESSASMLLWLHAGAGKTKAVSRVVDHIQEELAVRANDEAFAYFYFNRNDSSRHSSPAALCSLVRQLSISVNDRTLPHALVQLYNRKKQQQRQLAEECLHEADAAYLLRQLANVFPQTTLVLDALDECDAETRLSLVNLLDELVRSTGRPVKVFISSRLDEDIRQRYMGGPNVAIRAVDNQDDIARFVEAKMAERQDWSQKMSEGLRKEIVRTITDESEGMFQWAALQLGQLLQLWREGDIRARLGKLPIGLEQTYAEMLAAIRAQPGSAPAVAERAFQWVMCAFRPLTAAELVVAVCQDPESDAVQPVDVDINFVLRTCRNLLVVDPEANTCGFSHLSVQEYLESRVWSASQAHALVAKTCLTLLVAASRNITRAPSSERMTTELMHWNGDTVCGQYADTHWPQHVQNHGDDNIDVRLAQLLKAFLGSINGSSPAYQHWYRRIPKDGWEISYHLHPSTSASLCICYYGFNQILAEWWESGFEDPHQRNGPGDSLLHLAVRRNCLAVTKRLLGYGFHPDLQNYIGDTVLTTAAAFAKASLTQYLLDAGANVNAKGGRYGCPLGVAAYRGEEGMLRVLLDAGADANAKGGRYGCPLGVAAFWGRESVVLLLLEAGADVNAKGGEYGCPLGAAVHTGEAGVVQLLLDAGANANVEGGMYGCPLGVATIRGWERVARLLLEAGADVNGEVGRYGCPLGAAAYWGRLSVARQLLDAGADLNAKGGRYGCPLGAAAWHGNNGVVRLLLDAGADVNTEGGEFGCPLGAAAAGHRIEAARLLLDSGADFNRYGGFCSIKLLSAAAQPRGVVTQLQLETTFDANENGGLLNTVISCTAMSPYRVDLDMVKLLVKVWASSSPCPRAKRVLAPLYTAEVHDVRDTGGLNEDEDKREKKHRRRRSI